MTMCHQISIGFDTNFSIFISISKVKSNSIFPSVEYLNLYSLGKRTNSTLNIILFKSKVAGIVKFPSLQLPQHDSPISFWPSQLLLRPRSTTMWYKPSSGTVNFEADSVNAPLQRPFLVHHCTGECRSSPI